MRVFEARLRRLEKRQGATKERFYVVIINGYRTFEDCVRRGRPFFRCPDGDFKNVMVVHEYHGEKCVRSLDVSNERTKTILKALGYVEIKSEDEIRNDFEDMTDSELIDSLLGRSKKY